MQKKRVSTLLVLLMILYMGCGGGGRIVVLSVTASSNLFPEDDERYSPEYLLEERGAIWHAKTPVEYPQWIKVTFKFPVAITNLGIMAQEDSSVYRNEHKRGPKDFILQGSNDDLRWRDLLKVEGNVYTQSGEWKEWDFQNREKYLYYRIYITAGNDPGILTIQQIRLK